MALVFCTRLGFCDFGEVAYGVAYGIGEGRLVGESDFFAFGLGFCGFGEVVYGVGLGTGWRKAGWLVGESDVC